MKEYKFLKMARVVFKVMAWVVLCLAILVGIVVLITGGGAIPAAVAGGATQPPPRIAGLIFIIMGVLYFVILYTISDIIGLLLDIKESCAKTV